MLQTNRWKIIVVGSAAALVIGVSAVWGLSEATTAFAQTEEPTVETQGETQEIQPFDFMRFGRGFDHSFDRGPGMMGGGYGDELLANALGITEAELETARQTAHEAALEQAVEEGLLTQEQADQIQEYGFGGRLGYAGLLQDIDHDALLAEALGITVEELEAAKDNMIDAAVEAGLLTEAQGNDLTVRQMIGDAMTEAAENALQEAVDAGLITQAQADNLLDERGAGMWGFGHHRHGGRFGGRGGHGFNWDFGRGGWNSEPNFETPQSEVPDTDTPVVPSSL